MDPAYLAKRDLSLKKKKEKEAKQLYKKLTNNKDR